MYRFTLAEVELIPPEVPESSCNPEGRGHPSTGRGLTWGQSLLLTQNPLPIPQSPRLPAASQELPRSLCRAGSPAVADVPSADDTLGQLCLEVC